MKRTELAKNAAKKLQHQMLANNITSSTQKIVPVVDKREQRRRDQALGLVPFAIKLNSDLVSQLQANALSSQLDLNAYVAQILLKGLQ